MQVVENKTEIGGCDHKITMPVDEWSIQRNGYAKTNMAMLAAYYRMMIEWEKSSARRFCCFFNDHQQQFNDLISTYEPKYENATIENVAESYKKTLEKRLSIKDKNSGVQLKSERGIYNDD